MCAGRTSGQEGDLASPPPLNYEYLLHRCYIVMSPCAVFTKIRFASLDLFNHQIVNLTRVKLSKN